MSRHRSRRDRPVRAGVVITALTMLIAVGPAFTAEADSKDIATDASLARSNDAAGIAEVFADAIATGDVARARALLLPNVLIYESGAAETSAEAYAGHHLPADIAFMAGIKREVMARTTGGDGAASWVATRTHLVGRYRGKAVDLDSTETLILTYTADGWRIAHIHWSSAPHRALAGSK